ncbi:hypothetical protein BCV70DRAFT_232286 [Testicularia cyperi]|uniref:Uncharacterized protein n=1 Tax=Testicularia cyperi TaxID=1882483 RepID=A0A317XPW9_9BASI|nr:hypothetical protein BCV70DRAFT_232286 [Testicularia cyperi]
MSCLEDDAPEANAPTIAGKTTERGPTKKHQHHYCTNYKLLVRGLIVQFVSVDLFRGCMKSLLSGPRCQALCATAADRLDETGLNRPGLSRAALLRSDRSTGSLQPSWAIAVVNTVTGIQFQAHTGQLAWYSTELCTRLSASMCCEVLEMPREERVAGFREGSPSRCIIGHTVCDSCWTSPVLDPIPSPTRKFRIPTLLGLRCKVDRSLIVGHLDLSKPAS